MIIYHHQALGPFTHTKYAILVAVYWSSMDHEQKKRGGGRATMICGQDIMLPHLTNVEI